MTPLAFNPVFPAENQPQVLTRRNGKFLLRLAEKNAEKVEITIEDRTIGLQKEGGEIFEAELPFQEGIFYVQILVDGQEQLSPYLPIGYGYSRPYNYFDLEGPGTVFCALRNVPHGAVRSEVFFSSVTGEWERCMVYTPPGYETHPDMRYPVLYLQHGHGENEIGWTAAGRANLILDNLIADGKAAPFLIVMNNGMVQRKDPAAPEGHVVDHLLFEPMLLSDVIPFVEQRYRAGGDRTRRGIAGLSMGSMQTSMLACRHPEMFSEVGIFSGFLHDWISGGELDASHHAPSRNGHLEALRQGEAFRRQFHTFFRGIGDQDPFLSYFLEDDQLLERCGVETERKIYPGTHDWNVWRRCFYDFAQEIFRS